MIKCQLIEDEAGRIKSFQADGHAGYGAYGKDIVCSAVSAICATMITALTELLQIKLSYELKEGKIRIRPDPDAYQKEEVQLLLRATELGIRQLTFNYGKYVQIITKKDNA